MKAVPNRKLSVFQLGWLVRKGALNLPLTVQLVRAGLGFKLTVPHLSQSQLQTLGNVSQTHNTFFVDPPWIVIPVVGRVLLLV